MRSYLVTFELVENDHDQQPINARNTELVNTLLTEFDACQTLSFQWSVRSTMSADEIRDRLRQLLGQSDRMVVSELIGEVSHWWTLGDFSGWLRGKPNYRTIEEWRNRT